MVVNAFYGDNSDGDDVEHLYAVRLKVSVRDVVCFIETDGDGNGEGWRPNQMYSRDPCIEIYKCPHGYTLVQQ